METLSPRRARTDSGGMILDGTMQDAAPSDRTTNPRPDHPLGSA